MPEIRSKLRLSGSTVLDANGNGTVALTPDRGHTRWEITRVAVRTNQGATQTPFPQAELFDTPVPVPSASFGATASGHNDAFDPAGGVIDIGAMETLLVVWTGGVPGTTATATIRGHQYAGGF